MKTLLFLFLIANLYCLCVSAQELRTDLSKIPLVDYCEIIKNPSKYKNKIVRIFGEYRSGFEASHLGSQACPDSYGDIWIEFEKYESCEDEKTKSLLINREKSLENNWLEGTFVGKFLADGGGFGHMNSRPFQLNVSCIESVTLLPKTNSGCQRVDETSPFHYLEYLKTEEDFALNYDEEDFPPNYDHNKVKKKEKLVWFRLVNNSSCSIFVPTVESPETLENESKVLVVFKLDSTVRTSYMTLVPINPVAKPITNKPPKNSTLSGGDSIYFAVPLKYFNETYAVFNGRKDYWNISVLFKYVDRESEKNYEPFYFSRNDLPKEFLK